MGLSSNFCQNIILLFLQRDLQRIFVPGNYQLYKYNYGSLEKEAVFVGNVYTTRIRQNWEKTYLVPLQ